MNKRFRKNYFINRTFQFRFILNSLAPILFTQLITYLTLEYIFWRLRDHGIALGIDPGHNYFKLLAAERFFSLKIFLITSFPLSLALIIWSVFYSHKIAGPLYKIRTYLENFKVNYKEKKKLTIRKGDFFQEIPDCVNKILEEDLQR